MTRDYELRLIRAELLDQMHDNQLKRLKAKNRFTRWYHGFIGRCLWWQLREVCAEIRGICNG